MNPKFEEVMKRMLEVSRLRRPSELARRLGISPQVISNFKRRGHFSPGFIVRFAETFHVSVDWLMWGEGHHGVSEKYRVHDISAPSLFEACRETNYGWQGKVAMLLDADEMVYVGKFLKILRMGGEDAVCAIKLSVDTFCKLS